MDTILLCFGFSQGSFTGNHVFLPNAGEVYELKDMDKIYPYHITG